MTNFKITVEDIDKMIAHMDKYGLDTLPFEDFRPYDPQKPWSTKKLRSDYYDFDYDNPDEQYRWPEDKIKLYGHTFKFERYHKVKK